MIKKNRSQQKGAMRKKSARRTKRSTSPLSIVSSKIKGVFNFLRGAFKANDALVVSEEELAWCFVAIVVALFLITAGNKFNVLHLIKGGNSSLPPPLVEKGLYLSSDGHLYKVRYNVTENNYHYNAVPILSATYYGFDFGFEYYKNKNNCSTSMSGSYVRSNGNICAFNKKDGSWKHFEPQSRILIITHIGAVLTRHVADFAIHSAIRMSEFIGREFLLAVRFTQQHAIHHLTNIATVFFV